MIDLLAIHEAMPGHYLEGAHSAQFPSTLRAVLRSGLFAEGWAVYTEKMMTDAGYLDGDPLFRLVQLKFYLRTIANAILDQGVHVDGWSREQAMHLMTRSEAHTAELQSLMRISHAVFCMKKKNSTNTDNQIILC